MRIIDRLRYNQQIKNMPIGGTPAPKENPLLKKQLEDTQKDLNLILNKWKFGDAPLNSAQEFLNNFEPWINRQMKDKEELKEFLEEQGASNLTNLKETWKNTEADYLRRIEELRESKELPEDYDDLITERDEAIREKKTLEQTNLALSNRLTLKQQEVNNKDKSIEKLKKEASEKEISLNKKITEKNNLITTLNQEIKEYKEIQARFLSKEIAWEKEVQEWKESNAVNKRERNEFLTASQNAHREINKVNQENKELKEEIKKIKEKNWK